MDRNQPPMAGDRGMADQGRKAERFRALHVRGTPVILFNIWDPGSAKAVASGGALALATGSWSVAHANGFADGEETPLTLAIDNLRRIARAVDLPVTIDLESGYGETPEKVGETIRLAIEAGAVGCNLEDSFPADGSLRETAAQVARLRRARQIADAAGIGFFVNARTTSSSGPPSSMTRRCSRARSNDRAPMPMPAPTGCSPRVSATSLSSGASPRLRLCRSTSWSTRGPRLTGRSPGKGSQE